MKWMALAATLVFLCFGALPVFAGGCPDSDGDGIDDCSDNCSDHPNPAQDDTDGDFCGNVCDADYEQFGNVSFGDLTVFVSTYLTMAPNTKLTEPVAGANVNFADWIAFAGFFGGAPGPSGTTPGTISCP